MRSRADDVEHQDDDEVAFTESVRGTRKLGGAQRVPGGTGLTPGLTGLGPAPRASAVGGGSAARLVIEDAGVSWSARADGVSQRILRRMRDGIVRVEAHLDLHGLTRSEAAQSLDGFLAISRQAGRRCLLVIHGRGLHSGPEGPALRDLVRERLTNGKHTEVVLACGSAAPDHGGSGATVLYLRR